MKPRIKFPLKISEPNLLPMYVGSNIEFNVFYVMSFLNESWTYDMAYLNYNLDKVWSNVKIMEDMILQEDVIKINGTRSVIKKPNRNINLPDCGANRQLRFNIEKMVFNPKDIILQVDMPNNQIFNSSKFDIWSPNSTGGLYAFIYNTVLNTVIRSDDLMMALQVDPAVDAYTGIFSSPSLLLTECGRLTSQIFRIQSAWKDHVVDICSEKIQTKLIEYIFNYCIQNTCITNLGQLVENGDFINGISVDIDVKNPEVGDIIVTNYPGGPSGHVSYANIQKLPCSLSINIDLSKLKILSIDNITVKLGNTRDLHADILNLNNPSNKDINHYINQYNIVDILEKGITKLFKQLIVNYTSKYYNTYGYTSTVNYLYNSYPQGFISFLNSKLVSSFINTKTEFVENLEIDLNNTLSNICNNMNALDCPTIHISNFSLRPQVVVDEAYDSLVITLQYNSLTGAFDIIETPQEIQTTVSDSSKPQFKGDSYNPDEEVKQAITNLKDFSFRSSSDAIRNAESITPTVFFLDLIEPLEQILSTTNPKKMDKILLAAQRVPVILKSVPVYIKDKQNVVDTLANIWSDALTNNKKYIFRLSKVFKKFIVKKLKLQLKKYTHYIHTRIKSILHLSNNDIKIFRNIDDAVFDHVESEITKPSIIISINDLPENFTFDIIHLNRFMAEGWGNIFIDDPVSQKVYGIMRLLDRKDKFKGAYVSVLTYSSLGMIKSVKDNILNTTDSEKALKLAQNVLLGNMVGMKKFNMTLKSSLKRRSM